MPIKYIGKKSEFTGNLLFEILNRLKNYGVGRVIIRNSYKNFPEMSYYIIRKVIPMRETIGPGPDVSASSNSVFYSFCILCIIILCQYLY